MRHKQLKSYGVIGLGRFGMALAIKLAKAGAEVIGVDNDETKVKAMRAYTEHAFVVADLNVETLRETGIQNCDTVIASMRSYSAWVPTNFTNAICRRKSKAATKR